MSDADFYIGKKIKDRYEVVSLIGNTSLGHIYLAKNLQEQSPQRGIFKMFEKKDAPPPKEVVLSLFWNGSDSCFKALEQHFSVPLRHKNIRTVFEFGRDDVTHHLLFIAMEALDGEPLSTLLDGRPLALLPAARLFGQLCSGVAAAHACGTIHGGIEPEAIFVQDPGGAESIKVMNFGLSRIVADNEEISDREPDEHDNPYYLCPERVKDQKVEERSDVYSLGCILYAMLSGHPPYYDAEKNYLQVLFEKITKDPVRLSEVNPDIPYALTEVVMKAISTDPRERYPSVDDLLTGFIIAYRAMGERFQ